jgi:hypothetical protein
LFNNQNEEKGTMDDLISKKEKLRREKEELSKLLDETKFEQNDVKALIIAALTTILPVVLIGALFFYLVIKFMFR